MRLRGLLIVGAYAPDAMIYDVSLWLSFIVYKRVQSLERAGKMCSVC